MREITEKWKGSGFDSLMFEGEHILFYGYPAEGGKTAEFAVAADDSVARNDKRQGIFRKCISDGPTGFWPVQFLCQSCISYCLAESCFPAGGKDFTGESMKTIECDGNIRAKAHNLAVKIGNYLFLEVFEIRFIEFGFRQVFQNLRFDFSALRLGKLCSA